MVSSTSLPLPYQPTVMSILRSFSRQSSRLSVSLSPPALSSCSSIFSLPQRTLSSTSIAFSSSSPSPSSSSPPKPYFITTPIFYVNAGQSISPSPVQPSRILIFVPSLQSLTSATFTRCFWRTPSLVSPDFKSPLVQYTSAQERTNTASRSRSLREIRR